MSIVASSASLGPLMHQIKLPDRTLAWVILPPGVITYSPEHEPFLTWAYLDTLLKKRESNPLEWQRHQNILFSLLTQPTSHPVYN